MPNTIAGYFTDELAEWNKAINFYAGEMDEFEKKLAEVIGRNSIVGIAEKVEAHQTLLDQVSRRFQRLQSAILRQEEALKTDSTLLDNSLISAETEKRQIDLRRKMQAAEREYIDMKFDCYNFLSGTLKK